MNTDIVQKVNDIDSLSTSESVGKVVATTAAPNDDVVSVVQAFYASATASMICYEIMGFQPNLESGQITEEAKKKWLGIRSGMREVLKANFEQFEILSGLLATLSSIDTDLANIETGLTKYNPQDSATNQNSKRQELLRAYVNIQEKCKAGAEEAAKLQGHSKAAFMHVISESSEFLKAVGAEYLRTAAQSQAEAMDRIMALQKEMLEVYDPFIKAQTEAAIARSSEAGAAAHVKTLEQQLELYDATIKQLTEGKSAVEKAALEDADKLNNQLSAELERLHKSQRENEAAAAARRVQLDASKAAILQDQTAKLSGLQNELNAIK